MEQWDFLKYALPMSIVAGGAFAIVSWAFRWTWRLATLEQESKSNASEISRVEEEAVERSEKLEELITCLPRIELKIEQLFEERHAVIRSSASL